MDTTPRLPEPFPGATLDQLHGPVRIMALGRKWGGSERDWSFRSLQNPEDARDGERLLVRTLPGIARHLEVARFLVPSPVRFNGRVVSASDLKTAIELGDPSQPIAVARGTYADGVSLRARSEAFAISTGGCPVVVLWRDDSLSTGVVAAHAGLESLLRWKKRGHPEGWQQSIVHSMFDALRLDKESARACFGGIILPIDPCRFSHSISHPEHAADNQRLLKLLDYNYDEDVLVGERDLVQVDLAELIVQQLEQLGVPRGNIDKGAHTGTFPEKTLWTTREPTPPEHRHRRNLIVVAMR